MSLGNITKHGLSYINLSREPFRSGMLSYPFGKGFFPRIDHASHRVSMAPQHKKHQHSHLVYHILISTGGSGTYLVDSQEIPAKDGLLLLVGPGVPHTFNNTPKENKEFCVITFEWLDNENQHLILPFSEMISQWSGQPCTLPVHHHLPEDLSAGLTLEIEQMVKAALKAPSSAGLATTRCLWQVLYELTTLFQRQPLFIENETSLLRVRHYIQTNYPKPISLPELAKIACLTPNYVSSSFKKAFGVSPVTYQNKLRIRAACALLASSEYAVKEIPDIVGFMDVYYFSKVFKTITGKSPAAFRKESFSKHNSTPDPESSSD